MSCNPKVYFFTGSSGAGKTTLMESLAKEYDAKITSFLHFDNIGVPSEEVMIKEYGSGSNWQKAMTYAWAKKMLTEYSDKQLIFFEGQVNLDFITEAFARHNFSNYKIILVHCENMVRNRRLVELRKQPELVSSDMDNWSDFLLNQAIKQNALIVDTSNKTTSELVNWCKDNLK